MLICEKCGSLFEDDYEKDICHCGGFLEEARMCELCGDYFSERQLILGVCKDCLDSSADLFSAIELGEENPETIKVNGFIASLGEKTINALLAKVIKEDTVLSVLIEKAEDYCLKDKECFADFLTQEKADETVRKQSGVSFRSCDEQVSFVQNVG